LDERFPEGPLTILFSDVEGSTDLRTQRGDAAAHRILRSHEEIVRMCVDEHDGREVKALGDGFMVAFISARKALSCAVAIQQSLDERNRQSPGDEVRVRIGINTGEVVVEGDDLYGQAVNAAARIATRARGGEILVSEVVRQLAGSGPEFSFRDRGRFRLKGFPDRWHLYGLISTRGNGPGVVVPFAERTPFVGREAERSELRLLMDRAAAGEGGLVMIGGEPGVGKTRLSEELAAEAGPRFRVLVGHCYESGRDVPYMPWVEMTETAMAETPPDELRQALGDEAPEFARLVPELRRLFPDIPPPVEVPPEQQRRYTFNSIRDYVTRVSRVQPRLYVLEDLHWADESTLLLLEHLVERLPSIPCLVVSTYRDPPMDISPQLAETLSGLVRRRKARLLSLRRHSEVEVESLLRALSGQAPPPGVRGAIYGETEGNVFFVEEVYRHLAESGRLLDEEGRYRPDIEIGELDVPANVRLVTGQRLERVSATTQQTLGIAAVAGATWASSCWRPSPRWPATISSTPWTRRSGRA
jgi:class 3 adenylate cyclase